ncbi:MAG TPA: mersacidin/lichenicidin family type 2 lantibiotic [Pyrinomonadaceae bacterium]|jgi:mersacidin/lichenicidin family type 2 lantibiotic|nr:mersacidin/lichenicidin family type 2 lantibiotic [Pyrinomonadaceae bacterium]
MTNDKIIRAWKDPNFREGLSPDELAQMPEHPAGLMALTDDDLSSVRGGFTVSFLCAASMKFCTIVIGASLASCHRTVFGLCNLFGRFF